VESNLVFFDIAPSLGLTGADLCARLKGKGVLMLPPGARRIRAVTHLDVSREGIERALVAIAEAVKG
jgi:threonine aldolase